MWRPNAPVRLRLFAASRFALGCAGLVLTVLFAGCGRRETPVEAADRSHTLLLGNGAEPADLDPPAATAVTEMNVLFALFEGLTALDEPTGRALPGAAERWEVSDDGLTWTFHLRPNARWSNGDELVADDFVQSFRRTVAPALAFQNAYYLFPLRHAEAINSGKNPDVAALGCSAPDPHTLVLRLERPTPHLPLLTALTPWYPVNPRVVARFGGMRTRGTAWTRPGNLVGNGAFQLTEWNPNARLTVARNPHYWNAAHTRLERIVFFPIEDPEVEEGNFRAGQLHVTYTLPISRIAVWRERDPQRLRLDPLLQTVFVAFNTARPPFNDARLRRALSLAIDRTALTRGALAGSRQPAFSATPPNTGGYTAQARVHTDVPAARELLAAAGHPAGAGLPVIELQVRNDEVQPLVAQALQSMWSRELGLRTEITQLEQKTWLQNQSTLGYTMALFSWAADYPDPLTFLSVFVSDNGNNWTGWKNPQYDALIAQASTMNDASRRAAVLQEAEALLLANLPVAPIYQGVQSYLIDPAVKNWAPALLGNRRYQLVDVQPPSGR